MRLRLIFFIVFTAVWFPANSQEKPKKPYVLYEEAEEAYNSGKYEQSLSLLNQCLKVSPGYFEAYSLRGSVKENLKDPDGALTDYSIFLEQFPERMDVLMSRAILRYKIGFYGQAREDFLKLLTMEAAGTNVVFYRQNMTVGDKNPVMTTRQSGHQSYMYNYLGLTESKLKHYVQAIAYFDSAIGINENEPDYYVNRGLAKEALNDSTASTDYEKALHLNNNHTLARHNLTALKEKRGETTYEDRLTETIQEDSTMLYPYLERALQRFEGGYYRGALEDYTKALEIEQQNEEIWLGRGLTREKLKDYEGAFSDYTKAIDVKEDFFKAWINRGNVLFKLERYNDAIEDFNVALIYQSDYAPAIYNRALAKIKLKNRQEACVDLKRAEELGMKVEKKIKSRICD